MASNGAGSAASDQALSKKDNPSDNTVQRTRSWTGLWVVVGGDLAIAVGAGFGAWKTSGLASTGPMIAILTSAFTAVSTMTTAYFGIRTMSNTAQSFAPAVHTAVSGMQSAATHARDGTGQTAAATGVQTRQGAPIPKDPQDPTDEEIVARMEEPPSDSE